MNKNDVIKLATLFFLLIIFWGCQSTESWDDPTHAIEAGNYFGIFVFTENGSVSQGNVRFTFTNDSYTCVPEIQYLPPTGGGKYKMMGAKIVLQDLVPHTAEFDWSLILEGEFSLVKNYRTIILTQKDKKRNRFRYIELIKQIDDKLYE